jgi:hypothetical protein
MFPVCRQPGSIPFVDCADKTNKSCRARELRAFSSHFQSEHLYGEVVFCRPTESLPRYAFIDTNANQESGGGGARRIAFETTSEIILSGIARLFKAHHDLMLHKASFRDAE